MAKQKKTKTNKKNMLVLAEQQILAHSYFSLYAELIFFLKFVYKSGGGVGRFHNVNDRKKLSVGNIYCIFRQCTYILRDYIT